MESLQKSDTSTSILISALHFITGCLYTLGRKAYFFSFSEVFYERQCLVFKLRNPGFVNVFYALTT